MCGNACLSHYKTCRCGKNDFNYDYDVGKIGKICCAPSGNCIKDNQGKLFRSNQVTKSLKTFWTCLGNGFCSHGTIQEEGTECHGICPVGDAQFVRLPCQTQGGKIKCSQRIWPSKVCRGSTSNICPQ